MPLVNVFTELLPGELMIIRGAVTTVLVSVIIAFRLYRITRQNRGLSEEARIQLGPLFLPSFWVIGFSFLFSTATVPFYYGIRAWGAGPSLVVLTGTPLVNIAAKLIWHKQPVAPRVFICLLFLAVGVVIALDPFSAAFSLRGFLLSVTATILVGLAFEVLSAKKNVDPYNKSFWLGMVTVFIGIVVTLSAGRFPFAEEVWTVERIGLLVTFGLTAGFLYYLCNIIAFEHLKTEVASLLAMAETPAVILGAWFMLGEKLAPVQVVGVAIALSATLAFGRAETKAAQNQHISDTSASA